MIKEVEEKMSLSALTSKELSSADIENGYANEDQTKTFREFFKTYNTMSQICFNLCVWDFGTNELRYVEGSVIKKAFTAPPIVIRCNMKVGYLWRI